MSGRRGKILATTTVGRAFNYLLLSSSFRLSNLLKRPIHWGRPMAVSIEPTTACNLRCPQCPSGLRQFSRPQGNLKLDVNREILDGLGKQLQYINYYFQGEPFIHPNFLELVKEARRRNIYVVTSTNAHFISEQKAEEIISSRLSEIIISIDGMTQETYEKYRVEGHLSKVLEGTKNLIAAKKRLNATNPIVTFQFLVVRYNEDQIDRLHQLAREMEVDRVTLKTVQIYDFENGNDLIPSKEKYSRYRKNREGKYELKNRFKNRCWRMWSSCVFTWDGRIVPCCFDKDAKYQLGELKKATDFQEIWKSAIYQEFRKKLMQDRQQIDICKNCSEGSKVWI